MSATSAVSIVVGLIVFGLGVVVFALRKRKKRELDYRSLFIMGAIWLPVGIVFLLMHFLFDRPFIISMPFLAMGLIYLLIGLANKGRWKEPQTLTASRKKITIALTAVGIAVFVVALALYLMRVL